MTANKPGPKLNEEQRNALLVWLAAEYSGPLIKKWFAEREWPEISDAGVSYYRKEWAEEIADARSKRRRSALSQGIALKEERIRRLAEHADELEAIKWLPDEKGRLWNEKAWRETLDDIAKEMGHRRTGVDVDVIDRERTDLLKQLKTSLPAEIYAQVAAALLAGDRTGTA
jgi:hypothetical protein